MRAKVALVCDSAACLPPELVSELGIQVVPMELVIDGRTYMDGVDITPGEFYSILGRSERPPTTAAPQPASFVEAIARAAGHGDAVLCLTLLSTISATHGAAEVALELAKEALPGVQVELMDTGTAAGAQGLVVLAAARAAAGGADLPRARAAAARVSRGVELIAFLDTLHYLWKGGRVPRIAAWATSVLALKPMMEMKQGEIRPLERPRTRRHAIDRLLALVRKRADGNPIRANVMHALASDDAEAIRERLMAELECIECLVSEFTPVMGAHTGPGLVGIAFHKEEGD